MLELRSARPLNPKNMIRFIPFLVYPLLIWYYSWSVDIKGGLMFGLIALALPLFLEIWIVTRKDRILLSAINWFFPGVLIGMGFAGMSHQETLVGYAKNILICGIPTALIGILVCGIYVLFIRIWKKLVIFLTR